MTTNRKLSIAIDGPAGAGKSTIAKLLALRFGLQYVDTGAMYRAVGVEAMRLGVTDEDEQQLAEIANNMRFEFKVETPAPEQLQNRVFANGLEVTGEIRAPAASAMASKVSAVSSVRRALVAEQKKMGFLGGVVMEGRDICEVVLPAAEVKIFLTASPEVRARRRTLELEEKGTPQPFQKVLDEITERDRRDSTRADSPLKPHPDGNIVDTDNKSIPQVVEEIAAIANTRLA